MRTRILFVGDGSYDFYARAFYNAAGSIEEVLPFFLDYGVLNVEKIGTKRFLRRMEYHYCMGPDVDRINHRLMKLVRSEKIDIVFLYSALLIYAGTVEKLKRCGVYVALYHNDNPFSEKADRFRYRHYLKSVENADIVYAYRKSNLEDYEKAGAKRTKLLPSYYISSKNYYIPDNKRKDLPVPPIVFIGHFEEDGRIDYIRELSKKGIDVGVIPGWPILNDHMVVMKNTVERYNEILNSAEIAIIFLSEINKDTYTRRCFEIPMTKTMMLSVYTEDIASMYEEGKEIVFFRSIEDFVDKAVYYLEHDGERERIASAAYERCLANRGEAGDRVREILEDYYGES